MKKFILNFKQGIRFTVSIIASREFAFVYCILGTIAQISHSYFLLNSISSLGGGWRTTQAIMLSIFISSSLLYFTAIADNDDTKESRKIHNAVTMFTIIEILINIYYYSRHLIIDLVEYQIFDFVFAILISCLIPVTIKFYSSHIRAKEWIIAIEEGRDAVVGETVIQVPVEIKDINDIKVVTEDIDSDGSAYKNPLSEDISTIPEIPINFDEVLQPFIETYQQEILTLKEEFTNSINPENNEKISEWFETKIQTLDNEISKSFEKNRDLFLAQFENKVKMIVKKQTSEI